MEISNMTLQDLEKISNVLEEEFDDFWNYNILKKELQNPNSIYLVCKDSDEIIGFAGMTLTLDIAEINNIVIKKSYRGNGFSTPLLEELIKIAKDHNCIKVNLEVAESNKIAINLYKKFGFKQVGLRKKYYNGVDALLLTKNIFTI